MYIVYSVLISFWRLTTFHTYRFTHTIVRWFKLISLKVVRSNYSENKHDSKYCVAHQIYNGKRTIAHFELCMFEKNEFMNSMYCFYFKFWCSSSFNFFKTTYFAGPWLKSFCLTKASVWCLAISFVCTCWISECLRALSFQEYFYLSGIPIPQNLAAYFEKNISLISTFANWDILVHVQLKNYIRPINLCKIIIVWVFLQITPPTVCGISTQNRTN